MILDKTCNPLFVPGIKETRRVVFSITLSVHSFILINVDLLLLFCPTTHVYQYTLSGVTRGNLESSVHE